MKPLRTLAIALLGLAAATPPSSAQQQMAFDVLIRGGRVMDGTGNPWYNADVGIRGGKIAAIGKLAGATAKRTIDAGGKLVIPGFIDLHSHAADDDGLMSQDVRRRAALNVVTQGVTTVVVNPDGRSPPSIARQRASLQQSGIGPNTVLMVGHNTVRQQAMGDDHQRTATAAEVERMRALVRQGMEEGAFGLTAGLEYVPGLWSDTDEVVALVEEIVPYDGFFIEHERSGSFAPLWWRPSQDEAGKKFTLLDSVRETIEIGERTGARVVCSHIKVKGTIFWGSSHAAISLISRARGRGVQIFADEYPYTTSGSDGNTVLLPFWALGQDRWSGRRSAGSAPDYREALRKTLADASRADDLRKDISHEITYRGGPENIVVFEHPDPSYIGKSLAELAAARRQSPVEFAITLQLEGFPNRPGGARLRGFGFVEEDIEAFSAQPWVATASDGGIALPEDGPAVHARYYGTFPRKIRRYALDRGVISMEFAVRAGTSLPAQIVGLRNRGLVREGFWADVAVMDPERIRDKSTFTDPHQYAEGIEYVLVNGQFVVDGEGKPTGSLPGVVITPKEGRVTPSATQ
ncbi:MAG: amidohydrolase family protein [Gemmatimonadetes bacterium]|nr:amidohydrolase family protein [Gemmatimonadota bacterium]